MNKSYLCVVNVLKSKFQWHNKHTSLFWITLFGQRLSNSELWNRWCSWLLLFTHHACAHCVSLLHNKRVAVQVLFNANVLYVTHSIQQNKCALKVPVQQCPESHARCSPPPYLRLRHRCCCSPSTASQPTALPGIIRRWFSFFRQQPFDAR